jgi:hypothetical protein
MLIGVGYDSWFPPYDPKLRYDYRVVDASLPFFEGTQWKTGEAIGNNVVGYEWDNRDPERDGQRLWKSGSSAIAELPADRVKVLFEAEPIDVDGKKGKAEAVYFETPAGARVFNAGTIRWSWGVGKPEERSTSFQTFNRNLVLQMLAGAKPLKEEAPSAPPPTAEPDVKAPPTETAPKALPTEPEKKPANPPTAESRQKKKTDLRR